MIRAALLVALAVAAGAAALVPVDGRDWLLAGTILAAGIVQTEITRRTRREVAATVLVWAVAAVVAVHLTLAVAVVVALVAYRWRRAGARDAWRAADLGLAAALVVTGALAGALGSPLAVLAAVPVVVMLHSAGLTRQFETEAAVDQKTGLATAAAWQAHAERVFAEDGAAGLLMIDLDHFKRLNDTYGHHAGDDVLAAVGACLRSQLRHADLAGRFGGEEFTVVLPGADMMAAMATAERIRTAIAALRVTTVDNRGRHTVITGVTASIGAATRPHHGTTVRDCLRIADGHAYQAKRQGRNTIVGIDTTESNPPGGPATSVAERG